MSRNFSANADRIDLLLYEHKEVLSKPIRLFVYLFFCLFVCLGWFRGASSSSSRVSGKEGRQAGRQAGRKEGRKESGGPFSYKAGIHRGPGMMRL